MHVVDRVEEFAAELQFPAFMQRKILRNACVEAHGTRTSHGALANVPEGSVGYITAAGVLRTRECRRTEPRYAVDCGPAYSRTGCQRCTRRTRRSMKRTGMRKQDPSEPKRQRQLNDRKRVISLPPKKVSKRDPCGTGSAARQFILSEHFVIRPLRPGRAGANFSIAHAVGST